MESHDSERTAAAAPEQVGAEMRETFDQIDRHVDAVTDAEVEARLRETLAGEQPDRLALVRQLCDAYKDQPPAIFRGPGLSEHGEGYNHGARDLARAVLSYLDDDQADDGGDGTGRVLIEAARVERERRYAAAYNALGRQLAAAGRFATLSERRVIMASIADALAGNGEPIDEQQRPQSHPTHRPQWAPQLAGPGEESWCGLCQEVLFNPQRGITDAGAAPCAPPAPAPAPTGQLTVSPMLPADGWVDVDQASTVCGQVERIGSRFADVDGPGQVLVLVRLPDGTPVMGAAALHLFVAGTRNLRPKGDQ